MAMFRLDALVVFRAVSEASSLLKHALCCDDTRILEVKSGVVFGEGLKLPGCWTATMRQM